MKAKLVFLCLSLLIGVTYARLGRDALRKALGSDPLFSAPRNNPVPFMQNTNIHLPVSDVDANVQVQSTNDRTSNARPKTAESRTRGNGVPVKQKSRLTPVRAGRPSRTQEVRLGQVQPAKVVRQQAILTSVPIQDIQPKVSAMKKTVNDRLLNDVMPAASAGTVKQQGDAGKQECTFQIPSFLLPGQNPNNIGSDQTCPSFMLPGPKVSSELISLMVQHFSQIENTINMQQVEFEQKCLVPALRAHVFGGKACRTREMKVYLEWLLYLRQQLFNI